MVQYTKEELIEWMRTVADELGTAPSHRQMTAHSEAPSSSTYKQHFGSWSAARKAASLDVPEASHSDSETASGVSLAPSPQYTNDELLSRLQDLADELGRSPTMNECNEFSDTPSAGAYQHRFRSWSGALTAAGLAPRTVDAEIPREELLDSLRTLADKIGRTPTHTECDADPDTASVGTYRNRFGSWTDALHAAGIDPLDHPRRTSREDLLTDLQNLAGVLGRSPRRSECDEHPSMPHSATYWDRFGSWEKTLQAAELDPEATNTDSRHKLLVDIQDLVDTLGEVPTEADMNEFAPFALHTYELKFGSWDAALETAGISEQSPPTQIKE